MLNSRTDARLGGIASLECVSFMLVSSKHQEQRSFASKAYRQKVGKKEEENEEMVKQVKEVSCLDKCLP